MLHAPHLSYEIVLLAMLAVAAIAFITFCMADFGGHHYGSLNRHKLCPEGACQDKSELEAAEKALENRIPTSPRTGGGPLR